MDIKTKLEDDEILFSTFTKNSSKSRVVCSLRRIGINTIEDFINAKKIEIGDTYSQKRYVVMANIFRNAYLGEEFKYKDILEKTYKNDQAGVDSCGSDLASLSIALRDKYVFQELNNCLGNTYDEKSGTIEKFSKIKFFDMADVLRDIHITQSGPNIRKYYIDYINKLENTKAEEISDSIILNNRLEELNNLKIQLQTLKGIKENIERQMRNLQSQISISEDKIKKISK